MAEETETEDKGAAKRSRLPLILGVLIAVIAGGASFYAVSTGLVPLGGVKPAQPKADSVGKPSEMPDVAFVPVTPLVVSLGDSGGAGHLRFKAQLEVGAAHKGEVESLMPRVVDVLNTYLRALEIGDLTDSAALVRLRAQMLRRIQIVTGHGRVNDLLIMEFVIN